MEKIEKLSTVTDSINREQIIDKINELVEKVNEKF